MREVILDTETTGLSPNEGHRIVEIGAIELINHLPTNQIFHVYLNPERMMPKAAENVHGLSDDFLADKAKFKEIADTFLDFLADSPLIIHNAAFDMGFLNAELDWAGKPRLIFGRAIDTLELARRKFPGAQASLDALCRRFRIDNSMRKKHGALLDAEILSAVYLELIGGKQPDFMLAPAPDKKKNIDSGQGGDVLKRKAPLAPRLSDSERAAHADFVETLGEKAFWRDFM